MSSPVLSQISRLLTACLLLAVCVLLVVPVAAYSAASLKRGAGFTVVLRTEQLKDYLRFDGSPLRKIVRVKVSYFAGENQDGAEPYEEFFYSDGEVIGLRRLKELQMGPMSSYAINLIQKDGSGNADEVRAGTNAALRVWMNLKRKHCLLTALVVPDGTLFGAEEELRRLRFQSVEAPTEDTLSYATILTVFEAQSGLQRYFAYLR